MLRRLMVVGLTWACLCVPALAHAGTVAIFYYPWYGTPAQDGDWQHWNQNSHWPPGDLYSRFYPASGPYSSSNRAKVRAAATMAPAPRECQKKSESMAVVGVRLRDIAVLLNALLSFLSDTFRA